MKDKRVEGGVDGDWSYRITGQLGKDKYLKVTVPLGSAKASYTLNGWIKADSTPTRSGIDFKVVAYHEEEDDDGDTIRYTAEQKLNTFSEGWKYFCLLLPAHPWKDTSFTVRFYDNIGSLDIDGLQLTQNDVQTMQYDATGRLTSRYTAQKTDTYSYDDGLLLSQKTESAGSGTGSSETLSFTYDTDGKPVSITYKQGSNAAVTYFYAYNGQGDVIAIYNSSNSALVGSYEYDLWGKLISATPASATSDPNGILTKNPFRYRGYYYDEETGYYYLNVRYHDSACAESKPTPSTCLACARMIP